MKKIVYFLLFALCLPIGIFAQSVDDDLYFVPSKDKQEKKETPVKKEPKKQVTTNIYTSPGTTVVVQDRKGRTRDVDEYNRRYDARENEFVMDNDTLYIILNRKIIYKVFLHKYPFKKYKKLIKINMFCKF